MFKAASASSMKTSAEQAAAECIARIEGAGVVSPGFVLVHANCAISLRDFGRILCERWQGVRLHAATSCLGAMSEQTVAMAPDAGIVVLAISDPGGDYGVAAGEMAEGAEATGRSLARRALQDAGRSGEIPPLVLVCATPGAEEAFLAGVQSVVGPDATIVGGSAADNDISGNWRVFDQGEQRASGAVVSVLFPSVTVCAAFESGYSPTEFRGTITRAAGRRVFEIDGQPAASVYERWTGGAICRPPSGSVNILMASALTPLGRVAGRLRDMPLFTLSHPETLSSDGSLTLFTGVQQGEELVFMQGTATTLVNRACSVFRSAIRIGDIDPSQVSAMIMYYCGGCMLQIRDRMEEMRSALSDASPAVPMAVGFTFGEQGSLSFGPVQHGNLMISSIVFGR
jgi:hypothetical protein